MEAFRHKNYRATVATYEGKGKRMWIDYDGGKEICQISPIDGNYINPYNTATEFGKDIQVCIDGAKNLECGNYNYDYF